MVVVPTTITLLPVFSSTLLIVHLLINIFSVCISCFSTEDELTGLNVPAPMCNVSSSKEISFSFNFLITLLVKCKPAVGAATEPSDLA